MPLTHRIIVEVVRRGDLDAARSELRVDVIITNDRDDAVSQGQVDRLADEMLISLVVGVHCNSGIAKHGLWSSGCHHQISLSAT